MSVRVLIVEDDDSVARFLTQAVSEAGYVPVVARDGLEAVSMATEQVYDLILLDVMLPGLDGFSVSRRLRATGRTMPILIITAKDTLEDKIEGLDSGADDYIIKPFHVAELLARARALLRRRGPATVLTVGDLTLDSTTRQARRAGREIALSATEYSLLEFLMRHAGQVMSRAAILEHVWHYDFGGQDNVLDVYISYLRRKIDKGHAEKLIHTVRGTGYRLGAASVLAPGSAGPTGGANAPEATGSPDAAGPSGVMPAAAGAPGPARRSDARL